MMLPFWHPVTLHGITFMLFLTWFSCFSHPYLVSHLDCRFQRKWSRVICHYVPYSTQCCRDVQYIEWVDKYMDIYVPSLCNSDRTHCLPLFVILNAFGFTNWIMSGCIVFYASVVLPTINTQSNVIMLHGLLVRSLNILLLPLPPRQGLVLKYKIS